MKTRIYYLFMCMLTLLSVMSFSSCESEDIEIVMPAANFTIDASLYVANGEHLKVNEFGINRAASSEGISLKQVEYYFDDEKISTTSTAPFSFSCLMQNQSIGMHKLTIKAMVVGEGYSDTEFTLHFNVYVLAQPLVLNFDIIYDNESHNNRHIHNGETLSGKIALNPTTSIDAVIEKAEFYWDGAVFGTTSMEPFRFNLEIENQTPGVHELRIIIETSSTQAGGLRTTLTLPFVVDE